MINHNHKDRIIIKLTYWPVLSPYLVTGLCVAAAPVTAGVAAMRLLIPASTPAVACQKNRFY